MPVNSDQTLGWTRRSAAISVLLVFEEQRKRAGERVVALREGRSWSQEDLAGKSGLSVKTISRFENGRHEGRNETVRKLAKAFKVNEVDITGPPPAPLGLGAQPDDPPPPAAEADRVVELLEAVRGLVERQNELLARQSDILERIEANVTREEQARLDAEAATRDLREMLSAVDVASRALLGESQRTAEVPEQRAT